MVKTVNEAMTAITDVLRAKTEELEEYQVEVTRKYKLSEIPGVIDELCNGLRQLGHTEGFDWGHEEGESAGQFKAYNNISTKLDETVQITKDKGVSGEAGKTVDTKIAFLNNSIPEVYSVGRADMQKTLAKATQIAADEVNKYLKDPQNVGTTVAIHANFIKRYAGQVYEDGKEEGKKEGKQAERLMFWNAFQNGGDKSNYRMAFYNWNKSIYNPIYTIKSYNQNNQVFYYFGGESTKVPITLKGTTSQFFTGSSVTSIPLLDVDETVNFSDTATPPRENYHMFGSCNNLKNTTISGVIAKDMWIPQPPLTKDSILGIEVTYSEIEVGKILQTDYSNFGFRVDSHATNDSGDVTSIVVTPVQSEEQYAIYPISRLDEVSVTFNLVKLGDTYYWGGIFGALKDYSGSGTTHTLTLGTTDKDTMKEIGNLLKLDEIDMALATEKGWTLASWIKP